MLIGASVSVKGTNRGTITDVSGKYKLTSKGEDIILAAKYIGFRDKEVVVKTDGREKKALYFAMIK